MNDASINHRLVRGDIVESGGKLYALCRECRSIVRVNKPFIGSLHICEPASVPPDGREP